MTIEESNRRLCLFGIPPRRRRNHEEGIKNEDKVTENVRAILARLLAARSLRLAQLQTARDIYERAGKDDPRLYLFLAAMFLSEGQGNAYMRVGKVPSLLKEGGYLDDYEKAGFDKDNQQFSEEVKEHFADIDWNRCAEPLLGDIIVREGENWYFQRNQASVADVNKRLKAFVDANKKMGDVADAVVKKAAQFNGFTLNKEQEKALAAAAGNRFAVITGGPGTGKTTTVCAILRALFAAHSDWTEKDIALAAPTGRAAQRMSEAVLDQCDGLVKNKKETEDIVKKIGNLKGSTIHRLLGGYAPKWQHHEKNKLEQEVVIVDETSMVDIYLMHALIAALKDDARLILLGDADQLPSVDTGAVLGDLTTIGLGAFVQKLEVCERAKGEVSDVAKAINGLPLNDEGRARALVKSWLQIKDEELPCTEQIADGKSKFEWLCPKTDIKKEDIQAFYSKWMSGNELAAKARA
nr:AAA family ATPase [Kiritimatiellia bacterium]